MAAGESEQPLSFPDMVHHAYLKDTRAPKVMACLRLENFGVYDFKLLLCPGCGLGCLLLPAATAAQLYFCQETTLI